MVKDPRQGDSVLRHLVVDPDAPHPYMRRAEQLGESLDTHGGEEVQLAAQEGAAVSTPLRAEVYRFKDATESGFMPSRLAKAWTTRTMGSGVSAGASGYRLHSDWARDNNFATLAGALRRGKD